MTRFRIVMAAGAVLWMADGATAGRRAFGLTTPRSFAAHDTVWIEELT